MDKPAPDCSEPNFAPPKEGLLQTVRLCRNDIPKLEAIREKGLKAFAAQGLPKAKNEAWKYTPVGKLNEQEFIIETHTDDHRCMCRADDTCSEKNLESNPKSCACQKNNVKGLEPLEHKKHCHFVEHHYRNISSDMAEHNKSSDFLCCEHDTYDRTACRLSEQALPFETYEIHFINGKLMTESMRLPSEILGVSLLDAIINHDALQYLNKSFALNDFPFAALNTAYLEQGIYLKIPQGYRAQKPISIICRSSGEINRLANLHNLIVLENNAQLELIEYHFFSGKENPSYFNNIVTECFIGRHARLNHYKMQSESSNAFHIALNSVRVKQNADYVSFVYQRGANLARHESKILLMEEKATANVSAVYTMGDNATLDTTTNIEHFAPDTLSNQLVKGVIHDNAKGIFQGKISIAPNAVKTEGYQLHKALLLSDDAEVDVKPELEIFADDVKCSHGATCGELDAEQLFYLRSRGLSKENAEQLLIRAFIEEVMDKIENQAVREWLKSFI